MENRYTETSEDVKEKFLEIYRKQEVFSGVRFCFACDVKQKKLITLSKITDKYKFFMESDIMVIINEALYEKFQDLDIKVLFEQEISTITFKGDEGKISFTKPDVVTFSGILQKYGIEVVTRALQLENLTVSQQEDLDAESGFVS